VLAAKRGERGLTIEQVAAAVGLVLLASAFALYAWRQIESDQRPLLGAPAGSRGW
jgi:transcriptional regulator with XRE-family HTH domain